MRVKVNCDKCQAPIFLNRTIDCYGNIVATLNCWNGHYKWIEIENLQEDIEIDKSTVKSKKKDIIAYLGFFEPS